jgi:hypothetical protein
VAEVEYELLLTAPAQPCLDRLPANVAAAVAQFLVGGLLEAPARVGKPLRGSSSSASTTAPTSTDPGPKLSLAHQHLGVIEPGDLVLGGLDRGHEGRASRHNARPFGPDCAFS